MSLLNTELSESRSVSLELVCGICNRRQTNERGGSACSASGTVDDMCRGIAHRTRRGLRRGPWLPEATQQQARGSRGPVAPAAGAAAVARAVGAAPETVAVEPAAAGVVAAAVEPVAAAGIAAAVAVAAARSSSLAAAPAAAAPPIPCNPKQSVRNRLYSTSNPPVACVRYICCCINAAPPSLAAIPGGCPTATTSILSQSQSTNTQHATADCLKSNLSQAMSQLTNT